MLCQFQVYSKVNQSCMYIYPLFFRFFSHTGDYRVLSRVPCAIPQVLISYLFYVQQCVATWMDLEIVILSEVSQRKTPNSLYLSFPHPYSASTLTLVTISLFSISVSCFFLLYSLVCCIFQIPHISGIIQYFLPLSGFINGLV